MEQQMAEPATGIAADLCALLGGPAPWQALAERQADGRLGDALPEIAALFGVPQNPQTRERRIAILRAMMEAGTA